MKKIYLSIGLFSLFIILLSACFSSKSTTAGKDKMKLVWAEEFNYNGLPDTTKWNYDLGNGCPNVCGWGNNELQYYTANRKENARVENGHLIIEARREKMGGMDYTSSRMVSKHKGDWTYGRITSRLKLPKGLGVWPAFWMLPTDWAYGGWPSSGEIDIMENVGYMPDSVFGSIHTKRFNHVIKTQVTKGLFCNTLSSEFHEYTVEWDADKIDFFFDGKFYQRFENRHEGPDAWPFDRPFHVIFDLAVGGNWGGAKGVDTNIWPQQMEVDYVRVYQ